MSAKNTLNLIHNDLSSWAEAAFKSLNALGDKHGLLTTKDQRADLMSILFQEVAADFFRPLTRSLAGQAEEEISCEHTDLKMHGTLNHCQQGLLP